jgi:D-3-phosphoglycerate dehydrogenase
LTYSNRSGYRILLRNTVLTPHVAFYSEESIQNLQRHAAANVVAVLTGREPDNIVNPAAALRAR